MDMPDMSSIGNDAAAIAAKAKALTDSVMGQEVVGKVKDVAHEKLDEIKKVAESKGLGGMFSTAENMLEDKMGVDLDGDGDTGK